MYKASISSFDVPGSSCKWPLIKYSIFPSLSRVAGTINLYISLAKAVISAPLSELPVVSIFKKTIVWKCAGVVEQKSAEFHFIIDTPPKRRERDGFSSLSRSFLLSLYPLCESVGVSLVMSSTRRICTVPHTKVHHANYDQRIETHLSPSSTTHPERPTTQISQIATLFLSLATRSLSNNNSSL